MPEDVKAALDRFQDFLGQHSGEDVIDPQSGFTVADGMLLAGEIELGATRSEPSENPVD